MPLYLDSWLWIQSRNTREPKARVR